MANALEREDLNTITLLNSALKRDYGKSTSKQFACAARSLRTFVPESATRFLEINVQGICVLDPRTVQDHQEHFEDPRCLQRISQAVKQLVDLGGLSIEFNLHGIRQLDFSALTPLLEQGFAPTNLRDVRLIDRGGSIRPQVSDHVCFKLQIKQNLQYSDASRFLEVYVVAARALDPALLGTIERTLKMPAAFDESHKRSENS
ncbi:hypothetical protein ACJA88_011889 [Fusarium oxysporum]